MLTDNVIREHADLALRFAVANNYSNNIIRPLLSATHGKGIHAQEARCPEHGEPGHLLFVDDPVVAREWNRLDDAFLNHMLERLRFEDALNRHLQGRHR